MFISKKKYEHEKRVAKDKGFLEGMDTGDESDQWRRIEKLEKELKKIKKSLRKLEGVVKNGY